MSSPNLPACSRAVLVVDAAAQHGGFVLHLEPAGVAVRLDAPAAELFRALVARAHIDGRRKTQTWGDLYALSRAHQVELGFSLTPVEAEASLGRLARALGRHGIGVDTLVETNRKTKDFRLRRGLHAEVIDREARS